MRKFTLANFGIFKSSRKGILKNGKPSILPTVGKKKITFAETAIFYGPNSLIEYKPTKTDTNVDFREAGPSNFERNATFRVKKNLTVNRMGTVNISSFQLETQLQSSKILNRKIYKAENKCMSKISRRSVKTHKVLKMSSSPTIVTQMEDQVNLNLKTKELSNALEKNTIGGNCWYGIRKRLRRFCNNNVTSI